MTELELHEAAAAGDLDLVEGLLRSHRCDPNHRDVDWGYRTPLHWASAGGSRRSRRKPWCCCLLLVCTTFVFIHLFLFFIMKQVCSKQTSYIYNFRITTPGD